MRKSKPHDSSRIFVNYRREDTAGHVLALMPSLRDRFGSDRIFRDLDDVPPGQNFVDYFKGALESCSVMLVVIGPDWLTSPHPRRGMRWLDDPDNFERIEIATALKKENVRVIPVLVGRGTMPSFEELPPDLQPLSSRNAIELSDVRWQSDVEHLLTALALVMDQGEPRVSHAAAEQHDAEQAVPEPIDTLPRRIFLCYRRSDSGTIVGRIYDRLERDFGKENIFKDVDNIPFGVDFVERLDSEVRKCDVLFAIIGQRWLKSRQRGAPLLDNPNDFVRIEIASALRRTIPVVPVLVDGARMPLESQLPDEIKALARRHGTEVRHDPDFHSDMTRLLSRIG